MKFFMMSKCGEGCGLLLRLQREGNSCRVYVKEKEYYNVYDGILKKEKTCNPTRDEIVIFDSTGSGKEADEYRRRGLRVFSGSKFHDNLENSRGFGLEFMESCGIRTPETHRFKGTDFKKAYEFLSKSKEKFVFKPSGDLPSKLTYIGEDSEDLTTYMQYVERNYKDLLDDFVLQRFVEGAVVSSEFWCGPHGFVRPGNQTVEVKKFLNDDLGPSTGCSGNLVWLCEDSPILDKGILKAEKKLIENGYIGPIDLNTICDGENVYGLEWTPRFGLDAMPTLLQLFSKDLGKFISDLCQGVTEEFPAEDVYAGGVRLTIPPYPIETKKSADIEKIDKISPSCGLPIRLPEEYDENYYYYEVFQEDECLYHSSGTGAIAVVSFADGNCEDALKQCYDVLEEVKIPDKQYRTDLAKVLPDMYDKIEDESLCLA